MPQIAQQDYIRAEADFASISYSVTPELNNLLYRALKSGTLFDVVLYGAHPSTGEMCETRILEYEPNTVKPGTYTLMAIIPGFGGTVSGFNISAPTEPDDDEPIPGPGPK